MKKLFIGVIAILAAGITFVHLSFRDMASVGMGYSAKRLCSAVFVSERNSDDMLVIDLAISRDYGIRAKVDYDKRAAVASVAGVFKRRAIYRDGLGCTLLIDVAEEELKKHTGPEPAAISEDNKNRLWPQGEYVSDELPPGIDKKQLDRALGRAFNEPDPEILRRTRAVVVVYQGRIIAERYGKSFSKDTRQLGWSMSKSVTSALIGILVKKELLNIHDPAPVPEWSDPSDPRHHITTDQLLRMSSGLEFHEEYESKPDSDCNVMLFARADAAAYAAAKPLEAEPDTKWSYSSGTTMILARIIRQVVPGAYEDYLEFPRRELFDRIGMRSAIIETDPSGTYMGASSVYATPRDWARFGLLYLQDGVWEGERILPEGWVDYTRSPTPAAPPRSSYGAQFWLNVGGKDRWLPGLSEDLYTARGHDGQYVTIIPSKDLVVVRLGFTPKHKTNWDHEGFIRDILLALPE